MKKISCVAVLVAAFLLALSCKQMLYAQSSDIDVLQYKTSTTIAGFDYENEMSAIANTSRLIGLGEATHGSTEFELIKSELVKTLVVKYGYRHLVLEAGVPQCAALNEYLSTGKGDPERIMGIYFPWPYKTIEFFNLLGWLRAFNADRPTDDQVKFYGMDVHATQSLKAMRFELTKYGSITGVKDTLLLHELEAVSGTEKEKRNILEKMLDSYTARKNLSRTDSIIALNIIETQICNNISHGGSRYAFREQLLFRHAQIVIDGLPEEEKVMIWAHNNHVSKRCSARKSVGSMLYDAYGDQYKTVGFEFQSGRFRANSMDEKTKRYAMGIYQTEGCKDALGNMLKDLNKGILGIDVAVNKENKLIHGKQVINSIGAEYNYESAKDDKFYTERLTLDKSFDYLYIVQEMHPNVSIAELR